MREVANTLADEGPGTEKNVPVIKRLDTWSSDGMVFPKEVFLVARHS